MSDVILQVLSTAPEETTAMAERLGPLLEPGDVVLLSGDVGAGKTHFCRSLIQGLLPIPEDVPSPTYTLIQTYDGPECEIVHADLYRLGSVDEIEELGLLEAFQNAITLIEWPDRLGAYSPDDALSLEFATQTGDNARLITIRATQNAWAERLKRIADG